MSQQPVRPSFVPLVWAPNAAYPSGSSPWSNTPTKTPHPAATSVGVTPKTGFAAQNYNYNQNYLGNTDQAILTSLQGIYDFAVQLAPRSVADNWIYPCTGVSFANGGPTAACWDDGSCNWYVASQTAASAGAAPKVTWSHDNGLTFQDISSGYGLANTGEFTAGLCSNDNGGVYAIYLHGSGAHNGIGYFWNGTTWTNPTGSSTSSCPGAANVNPTGHYDTVLNHFNFYAAPQAGSTPANAILFAATPTGASLLARTPTTPPANFGNITACITAHKRGTNTVLYFPRRNTGSVNQHIVMSDMSDQTTWAATFFPPGMGSTANLVVNGLAWNATLGLWIVGWDTAGDSGTSTSTTFSTSPDGVTWTTCASTVPDRIMPFGLKAIGGMWLAFCAPGDSLGVSAIYTSSDNGATWQKTKRGDITPQSNPVTLVSTPGGSQLLYVGDQLCRASMVQSILT